MFQSGLGIFQKRWNLHWWKFWYKRRLQTIYNRAMRSNIYFLVLLIILLTANCIRVKHHTNGSRLPCQGESNTPKCIKQCEQGYNINYNQDKKLGDSVYTVNKDVKQIQMEIMKNGPVQTAFDVYEDFLNYKSGVYEHKSGKGTHFDFNFLHLFFCLFLIHSIHFKLFSKFLLIPSDYLKINNI